MVIASAEQSVRPAVGDMVADEAARRRGRKQGHRTAAGCVASVDKASSAEGKRVGTCRRDPQGRLWVVAADKVAARGGRGSLGCCRPRKSFGSVGVAAQEGCEDAVANAAAPGRLSGVFAADEAVGGRMSDAAAAHKADERPVKDVAFRGHAWLRRGAWGCCLWMRSPGGEGGLVFSVLIAILAKDFLQDAIRWT